VSVLGTKACAGAMAITVQALAPEHRRLALLDLGFFVGHVLAGDRIKFFDLHLFRLGPLVFGRGVEVTGTGGRFEFDLVAHDEKVPC
jgi:hypothetical protein